MKTTDALAIKTMKKISAKVFAVIEEYKDAEKIRDELIAKLAELEARARRIARHTDRLTKMFAELTDAYDVGTISEKEFSLKGARYALHISLYGAMAVNTEDKEEAVSHVLATLIDDIQNPIRKIFAKRLKEARKASGLTQAELALRLGLKRSTYGQFEQGRNEPNVSILPQLSRALNRPFEYFFE